MTGGCWAELSWLDARVLRATDARYERSSEVIGELAGCAVDVALSTLRRLRGACLVEHDGERPQRWLRTHRADVALEHVPWARSSQRCAAATGAVASGPGCSVRPKRRSVMSGQLALVTIEEVLVPAAVWETLPPERQLQVALRLARLLARLVEAARDE
ncbi:MAG: hypothetical protein ACRDRL_32840 [Sciscionella sp.]